MGAIILTSIFLFIVLILLPWLAVKNSSKQVPVEYKTAVFVQSIVIQVVIAGIALAVWHQNSLFIQWIKLIDGSAVVTFTAVILVGLLLQWINLRYFSRTGIAHVFNTSTLSQKVLKQLVYLSGAVGEEIAYRGVLFSLISIYVHPLFSAAIVGGAFGFGHFMQGWKGFAFSFIISLLFQFCLWQTGGLLFPIAAHYTINLMSDSLKSHVKPSRNH